MVTNSYYRRPVLRDGVEMVKTDDGIELRYLEGRRFIEFEFEPDRRERFYQFIDVLSTGRLPADELRAAFPGSQAEWDEMLAGLDEQGLIGEAQNQPTGGMTGIAAYNRLRRCADEVRSGVRSTLCAALNDGTVSTGQLIGYAVEYWHVTHLCPRALAPVLARRDLSDVTWSKLMSFYQMERNHDRMLEKSLRAVGITRQQLIRAQPLPATMAMMASLGVHAYQFPLALVSTLFPMEEPEPDFLEMFIKRANELGLPAEFIKPIVDHSDVNEDESHDAVTLDMLADYDFVSDEELRECAKAVADVIEQRARLDAEIMAWYRDGALRIFTSASYPTTSGMELVCAPLTFLA